MKNKLPQRLTDLLVEKNISKRKLAALLGVSATTITYWSRGDMQPTAEYVYLLADFFGVSADYLLGREDY